MSDLAAVRAQIKAWEYAFKADNGHEPSVQDIKNQPAIAEKYKLYKKLNKAKQAGSSSSILPKSRAVKTAVPVITSNPFSPVKNKGTRRAYSPSSPSHPPPLPQLSFANPFATPSKSKSQPRVRPRSSPSPDPFPPLPSLLEHAAPSASSHRPSGTPRNAVSRARKRLRGEPVSPSPVKEKRARLLHQSTLPFGKHSTLNDSDDNEDAGAVEEDADEPFIDDSPVKPSTGAKAYTPLFEETTRNNDIAKRSLARSQSKLTTEVSFTTARSKSRALSPTSEDEDADWLQQGKIKALDIAIRAPKGSTSLSRAASSLFSGRTLSAKRPTPPTETLASPEEVNVSLLLPPSPPPKDSKSTHPKYIEKSRAKGKGKATANSRKKAKQADEMVGDERESDSPEDEDVQVVTRKRGPTHPSQEDDGFTLDEWDPRPSRQSARENASPTPDRSGKVEVNLPEELQRVLDISTDDSNVRHTAEENLVKELLYRSRVMQYDVRKGGDVWDVGEEEASDVRGAVAGDEDEWEGEPVPWEVGEL
ncbi:hypothetical protein EUX98_g5885 [Antrodiella citrinella]|uniref:DNA replication regulator SLD2 n=1 Tax=Antrodiella citrinella TaxID=2447956 RepID=A0A4S4MQP6_9APHY|nr:hypothetical protein EUX98_g5885 [Antrodiella citrinella]